MVKSGFYDSVPGNPKYYDTNDFAGLISGIIRDGVFQWSGDVLATTAAGGLTTRVGTGRAWFDDTWTYNDSFLPLTHQTAHPLYDRIDTVILEVNKTEDILANRIMVVTGVPATNPVATPLVKSNVVTQYLLAEVRVKKNATVLSNSDIVIHVGTSTPFVTSVLEAASLDYLFENWDTQWNEWFLHIKDELTENQAGNLQRQIDELNVFILYKATNAEIIAGTNDTKYITPAGAKLAAQTFGGFVQNQDDQPGTVHTQPGVPVTPIDYGDSDYILASQIPSTIDIASIQKIAVTKNYIYTYINDTIRRIDNDRVVEISNSVDVPLYKCHSDWDTGCLYFLSARDGVSFQRVYMYNPITDSVTLVSEPDEKVLLIETALDGTIVWARAETTTSIKDYAGLYARVGSVTTFMGSTGDDIIIETRSVNGDFYYTMTIIAVSTSKRRVLYRTLDVGSVWLYIFDIDNRQQLRGEIFAFPSNVRFLNQRPVVWYNSTYGYLVYPIASSNRVNLIRFTRFDLAGNYVVTSWYMPDSIWNTPYSHKSVLWTDDGKFMHAAATDQTKGCITYGDTTKVTSQIYPNMYSYNTQSYLVLDTCVYIMTGRLGSYGCTLLVATIDGVVQRILDQVSNGNFARLTRRSLYTVSEEKVNHSVTNRIIGFTPI